MGQKPLPSRLTPPRRVVLRLTRTRTTEGLSTCCGAEGCSSDSSFDLNCRSVGLSFCVSSVSGTLLQPPHPLPRPGDDNFPMPLTCQDVAGQSPSPLFASGPNQHPRVEVLITVQLMRPRSWSLLPAPLGRREPTSGDFGRVCSQVEGGKEARGAGGICRNGASLGRACLLWR